MADKPCNTCSFYDAITRNERETKHGWCAPRSTYPHKEQPGQVFPSGVKRAAQGELAKPFIVLGADVVKHCTDYRKKP